MTKRKRKNNIITTKRISKFCIFSMIFIFALYVYSYQSSISSVAQSQKIERQISQMQSEIATIEYDLVNQKRKIKKENALSEGFQSVGELVFVKRVKTTAVNVASN
jgi:TolA-binding protein